MKLLQKAQEGSNKFLNEVENKEEKPSQTQEAQTVQPQIPESQDPDFPFTMKIRNNTLHFRGWKVKDIRLYKTAENEKEQKEALIYNLIKEPVILDSYESLYALIMIRSKSVDEGVEYHFKCKKCEELYDVSIKPEECLKVEFNDYEPFTVGEHTYQFQDLKNREVYESVEKSELMDMCMHVKTIDNDDGYTLEEVINYFEDLDLKDFRAIKEVYDKQRFTVTMHSTVKCTHCGNEIEMLFDTLPNFIPPEFEE